MGIFFDDRKPSVSSEEFRKYVRNGLASHNFTHKEIEFVEGFFHGDMNEDVSREKGVDAKELERGIVWLRTHPREHSLSSEQINILEIEMKKYI